MTVLAKQVQSVIQEFVGPHQTCGIKRRSIYTNIHTARSILECCDADDRNVAMLQINMEKAFDKVKHNILFSVLEYVKPWSVIIDGVRVADKHCTTNLIVNKQLSERIHVKSPVTQDCPISPLMFALYLEPLCAKVIQTKQIHGFRLGACEVKVLPYEK